MARAYVVLRKPLSRLPEFASRAWVVQREPLFESGAELAASASASVRAAFFGCGQLAGSASVVPVNQLFEPAPTA